MKTTTSFKLDNIETGTAVIITLDFIAKGSPLAEEIQSRKSKVFTCAYTNDIDESIGFEDFEYPMSIEDVEIHSLYDLEKGSVVDYNGETYDDALLSFFEENGRDNLTIAEINEDDGLIRFEGCTEFVSAFAVDVTALSSDKVIG